MTTPNPEPSKGQDQLEADEDRELYMTVEDAIGDLSFLGYSREENMYELAPLTDYQKEMWQESDWILQPQDTDPRGDRPRAVQTFDYGPTMSDLDEEYQTKKHAMMRWHPEEPAPTVTTLLEDFVHYDRTRIPTVLKIARSCRSPTGSSSNGPGLLGAAEDETRPTVHSGRECRAPKVAAAIAREVGEHLRTARTTPET